MHWYLKAAEQGIEPAQYYLGIIYLTGLGVPNYIEAYKWWDLAATAGNADAAVKRDNVTAGMTSEQIADAQRLVREWRPKMATEEYGMNFEAF